MERVWWQSIATNGLNGEASSSFDANLWFSIGLDETEFDRWLGCGQLSQKIAALTEVTLVINLISVVKIMRWFKSIFPYCQSWVRIPAATKNPSLLSRCQRSLAVKFLGKFKTLEMRLLIWMQLEKCFTWKSIFQRHGVRVKKRRAIPGLFLFIFVFSIFNCTIGR